MKKCVSLYGTLLAIFTILAMSSLQEVTAIYSGNPSPYWDEEWTQLVGSGSNVDVSRVSPDEKNGTVYSIGQNYNGTANFRYLAKLNGSGILMWAVERDLNKFFVSDVQFDPITGHIFVIGSDYSNSSDKLVQLWIYNSDGGLVTTKLLVKNETFNGGELCLGDNNILYAASLTSKTTINLYLAKIDLTTLEIVKSLNVTTVPNAMGLRDLVYASLTDDVYAFIDRAFGLSITNVYKIDGDTFVTTGFTLTGLNSLKDPFVHCAAITGDRIYLFGRNNSNPVNHFLSVTDLNLVPLFTTIFQKQTSVIYANMFLLDNASSILIFGDLTYSAYDDVDDIYSDGMALLYKRLSDPDTFRLESTVAFSRQGGSIAIRNSYITSNGTLYACGYSDALVSGTTHGFILKYPKFKDRMQGKMTINVLAPPETDKSLFDRILNQDWEVVGVITLISFILGALLSRRSSKSKGLK